MMSTVLKDAEFKTSMSRNYEAKSGEYNRTHNVYYPVVMVSLDFWSKIKRTVHQSCGNNTDAHLEMSIESLFCGSALHYTNNVFCSCADVFMICFLFLWIFFGWVWDESSTCAFTPQLDRKISADEKTQGCIDLILDFVN